MPDKQEICETVLVPLSLMQEARDAWGFISALATEASVRCGCADCKGIWKQMDALNNLFKCLGGDSHDTP